MMPEPLQKSFRDRIRTGDTLLGGFIFSTDPNITENYAAAGFDFVIIDLEHTMGDLRIVAAHLRAARAAGIQASVRIGRSQLHDVPRLIDAGCKSLISPDLGLPQYGAEEALRVMRYSPEGERPTCTGVPAAGFGLSSFAHDVQRSNSEVAAF